MKSNLNLISPGFAIELFSLFDLRFNMWNYILKHHKKMKVEISGLFPKKNRWFFPAEHSISLGQVRFFIMSMQKMGHG